MAPAAGGDFPNGRSRLVVTTSPCATAIAMLFAAVFVFYRLRKGT